MHARYGAQMSLKRITQLNASIIVSETKMLAQCGLECVRAVE